MLPDVDAKSLEVVDPLRRYLNSSAAIVFITLAVGVQASLFDALPTSIYRRPGITDGTTMPVIAFRGPHSCAFPAHAAAGYGPLAESFPWRVDFYPAVTAAFPHDMAASNFACAMKRDQTPKALTGNVRTISSMTLFRYVDGQASAAFGSLVSERVPTNPGQVAAVAFTFPYRLPVSILTRAAHYKQPSEAPAGEVY